MNIIGTITLAKRETWRFLKVWNQSVVAPMITTLLFLAILMLAMGGSVRHVEGIEFGQFLAPGLIMMAVVQNAFANTSSSLILAKMQGVIVDLLMPPLTGAEMTLSMVAGGVIRGMMVGVTVGVAVYCFVPFSMQHPLLALYYLLAASMMLALLGMLAGVWAQGFDQLSAVTNYVVTPLAFLSGTFYSIRALPEPWYAICHFNPFFYMIDGFRYAMVGVADSPVERGMIVLALTNLLLWLLVQHLITRGYRLKN